MTLDKSTGQEQIRALCHPLWLKLPEVFSSHSLAPTVIYRIIQKKRRGKAEQKKLPLDIISELLALLQSFAKPTMTTVKSHFDRACEKGKNQLV